MKLTARLLTVALTAFALLLTLSIPSQAAAPKKGGSYEGEGPNVVKVTGNGKAVKQFFFQTSLSQCSPIPSNTSKVKPAIKDGKFTWKGKLRNGADEVRTYAITGTFKTKSKLVVVVTEKTCHTPKRSFTLKLK